MKKTKLKYHFKFGMGETILREEVSDNPLDGLPVYSATEDDKVFGYKKDLKRVLNAGDIIIAARGTIGSVNILKSNGGCTQTTMYMKNLGDFNSYYVYYYLLGHRDTMFAYDKTAIPQLTISKFSNEEILLPTMGEQNRIVAFLDTETSKIDSLSEELARFKANLQLQKRSLVSECVTKGIPSERDRAYKDSGVEWLGEIPASWELNKLKRMATCHDNLRKPLNAEERGEIQGEYAYWGANSIQDYVNDYLVDGETVLLGEDAAPFFDKIKNVAFYTEAKIWPNNHIHVLKVKDGVNPRYFTEALNTVDYSAYITGSIRDKLTQGAMMRIALPLPPLDEQQRIADYLDFECAKIDALIGEIDNQVNLLKTYRKSIINEVVTGKVEV